MARIKLKEIQKMCTSFQLSENTIEFLMNKIRSLGREITKHEKESENLVKSIDDPIERKKFKKFLKAIRAARKDGVFK